MKELFRRIRDGLLKAKFYISRSASYISLLNLGMIMFLTFSKLKDMGLIKFDLSQYFIPLYIITLIVLALFGYLDIIIMKGYKTEIDIMNKVTPLHPDLKSLKEKVDYLYSQEMKKNGGWKYISV